MSCLFNSLSYYLTDFTPYQLRILICKYLSSNPNMIDDIKLDTMLGWSDTQNPSQSPRNLDNYINNMMHPDTWGSSVEIKSFCNIFDVQVNVHCDNRIIEFKPQNMSRGIINIKYSGRNHYTPMVRR